MSDARIDAAASSPARRFISVTLDGHRFLIDEKEVSATEQGDRLQRNPTSKPPYGWLLGASEGLEVLSLGHLLGCGKPRAAGIVLLVTTAGGEKQGLLVDTVGAIVEVAAHRVLRVDAGAATDPFVGVARTGDGDLLIMTAVRIGARPREDRTDSMLTAAAMGGSSPTAPLRMVWLREAPESKRIIGLSANQVVEIREPAPTVPFPGRNRRLEGIVVSDDAAVPVAGLARFSVGQTKVEGGADPRSPRDPGRLLIARTTRSERQIALPISAVDVVDLPLEHQPIPLSGPFVRGAYTVDDATVIVPDLDAFLG